jgi:crossover junction endodeoxyribonuclease RusA
MISLVLPYPPSLNTYWRNVGGRTLLSKKGRIYKTAVCRAVSWAGANKHLSCRLSVHIVLHPTDKRKRDIDNAVKAIFDGMQSAGVYDDDSQIDRLIVERSTIEKGGVAVVTVKKIGTGDPPATKKASYTVSLGATRGESPDCYTFDEKSKEVYNQQLEKT